MEKKFTLLTQIIETEGNIVVNQQTDVIQTSDSIIELTNIVQELKDEAMEDHDIEKEHNEDSNKTIAKYLGYFQPEYLKDKLLSNEVYSSYDVAKKVHPNQKIFEFKDNEIKNFEFADVPYYDQNWGTLLNILNKLIVDKNIYINMEQIQEFNECAITFDISKFKTLIVQILNYNRV